jgi:hypothetical protein
VEENIRVRDQRFTNCNGTHITRLLNYFLFVHTIAYDIFYSLEFVINMKAMPTYNRSEEVRNLSFHTCNFIVTAEILMDGSCCHSKLSSPHTSLPSPLFLLMEIPRFYCHSTAPFGHRNSLVVVVDSSCYTFESFCLPFVITLFGRRSPHSS